MTSKISFSKFLKQNISQRAWLFTLSLVLLLFCQTFSVTLTLDNYRSQNYSLLRMQEEFSHLISGQWLILLIPVLAVVTAVSGFSYLHTTEKTDFLHSLPLLRRQWFFIVYSGGLLSFAVPYLLSCLCSLAIGAVYGALTSQNLLFSLIKILFTFLGFILLYHTSILAMMLTGKLLTGVIAATALSIYSGLLVFLYNMMANIFWYTYYNPTSPLTHIFTDLSPAILFARLISPSYNDNLSVLFPAVFLGLIMLAGAWYLYKKRASESAGQPLAFPKTAPFIKLLTVVPLSLLIGGVFSELSYNRSELKWLLISSLAAAFILCGVVEFIYHGDLRQIFSGKISSLIAILCTLCILLTMLFDLPGYDTWLPDESRLENMSFHCYALKSYFCYPAGSRLSDSEAFLEEADETAGSFHPLYELAKRGVENVKSGITQRSIPSNSTEQTGESYFPVTIAYHERNGNSVFRNYEVLQSDLLEAFTKLCEREEYRKMIFPIFSVDPDSVMGILALDIYYEQPTSLPFTRSQQNEVLEAYKADVLSVDIHDLQYKQPLGELELLLPDPFSQTDELQRDTKSSYPLGNFFVYEDYRHTLAALKKYGYTFRTQIDPEDVAQLTLYSSSDTDQQLNGEEIVLPQGAEFTQDSRLIRDPEELAEIVPQLCTFTQRLLGCNQTFSCSAEVFFKDSASPTHYFLP